MSKTVKGPFEVKMLPQPPDEKVGDPSIGRFALDKVYSGELSGASLGQMLATMTAVKDSAGYVAIERVEGTLAGRKGGFALVHDGMMTRGEPSLQIRIVPDSGTGELTGISGSMTIEIVEGKHFYELTYTLPETV